MKNPSAGAGGLLVNTIMWRGIRLLGTKRGYTPATDSL